MKCEPQVYEPQMESSMEEMGESDLAENAVAQMDAVKEENDDAEEGDEGFNISAKQVLVFDEKERGDLGI